MNRHNSGHISGSLIRQSISTGTTEWKAHVPECLIDMIEDKYPKHLLLQKYVQQKDKQKEAESFSLSK